MYQRESRLNVFSTSLVSAVVALGVSAAGEEVEAVEVDVATLRRDRERLAPPSYATAAWGS